MNHVPEPWATALVEAGLTDPRYADPIPSLGQLAEAIGVHTSTVSAMVHGRKATSHRIVEAAADALRVDVTEVSRWVKQARTVAEPYQVPAEIHLLSRRQQAAVTEIIRAMAETREDSDHNDAPPMKRASDRLAQEDYGMAARPGAPDNPPDTTTGEESQDPGDDYDPA